MEMTYLSLTVLEEIYELGDGCTQKRICGEIQYPKQAVNPVVKTFLEEGYIELRENPQNRRNKEIFLTEAGKKLCREVVEPLLTMEAAAMDRMGERESRELVRLLGLYSRLYCGGMKELL